MELRDYLNSLSVQKQEEFAEKVGTSLGYLRKGLSVGSKFDMKLTTNIEVATAGQVTCEELRPDLAAQWAYLRASRCPCEAPADKEAAS